MSTTLVRIISALIAVALLVVVYRVFDDVGLMGITLLVGIGASVEYARLLLWTPQYPRLLSFTFLTACTGILGVAMLPGNGTSVLLAAGLVLTIFAMMFALSNSSIDNLFEAAGRIGLGLVYCCLLPIIVLWILMGPQGTSWFLTLLAVVFSNDTCAYFSGRLWGRKKMWEQVSPKKTWAGSVGGLAGSVIAVLVIKLVVLQHVPWLIIGVVGLLGGAMGQAGDMFESIIKRKAGVKDSGHIMPGHGGFLDRVDSVLFAAPIIYLAAQSTAF